MKPEAYSNPVVIYSDFGENVDILKLCLNDTDIPLCAVVPYVKHWQNTHCILNWQLIALFFPYLTMQVLAVCLTLLPARLLRTGVFFSLCTHNNTQRQNGLLGVSYDSCVCYALCTVVAATQYAQLCPFILCNMPSQLEWAHYLKIDCAH